jgi:uncharacterized protein
MPMRDALGAPEGDPDAGRGTASLELYADGTHVFASGPLEGSVTVACSRCLDPVRLPIAEALRVTFLPEHELAGDEDEGADPDADDGEDSAEAAAEDLDVFPFDGEVVDLEPVLREQFVLAVPFAPLCRADCKGLCPQCGVDLNSATCNCSPPIDPRLAPLKGLKLPL